MEPTGEHFSPLKTNLGELELNVDRYFFVLPFIQGKTVLDLGCGCGLGSYFYSMLAKELTIIDYNQRTLETACKHPFPIGVTTMNINLESEEEISFLPEVEVAVALEVLEHLEDPTILLRNLKAKRLVFSVPLNSMEVSTWHKYNIETVEDVQKLISPFYDIGKLEIQGHPLSHGKWVRGEGVRILQ